jgi:hypothetical protein
MAIRLTNKYTVFIVFLIIIMVSAISYMGSKESLDVSINGTTISVPESAIASFNNQFGGALQGIVQSVQVMTPTPPR